MNDVSSALARCVLVTALMTPVALGVLADVRRARG
jgi:hypothetical protein